MVQTRRGIQKPDRKTPVKKMVKRDKLGQKKKIKENLERCNDWIQQQKKEKLKFQPEVLDLDESDEEARDINLDAAVNETTKTQVLRGCEWQRCNRMFELHSEFHQHVLAHLQLEPTTLKCEWDLCDFESDDCAIFQRHVGHHVYMTKLKTVGEQLLHKRPMPPCLITSRTRNLIPNTDTKYVCMWLDCTYTFDMVEDYYEHARSHCVHELEINKQGNRNKHVQCRWVSCKKTFNKRQKMTDHMRTHTGERLTACANCGSTFNSYAKFYDHFKRQALNKSYKCYQCFASFHTEELLNNHTSAHVNRIKCTECDMTCPSNAALTQHFRYRHLKERPFKCSECDYAAVTKWDLNKHQTRMHNTDQEAYLCDECDYTCLTTNQMRKHERTEHGDGPSLYCCDCCDRRYKNGPSLSRHLIKHHGFHVPSGHIRFTYQMDTNGVYRVQTTRMESLEVSKQIIATPANGVSTNNNVAYALSEFTETADGIKISVIETEQPPPVVAPAKTDKREIRSANLEEVSLLDMKPAFNEIDSIETNTFMECLNLRSNHGETREHKNIDNFSVIQKYAKKKRQKSRITTTTTYIIEEFDTDGNMIKTQELPLDTELETYE